MMDWRCHPRVNLAASYMLGGQVVAYPTEAVWGLGCLPDNCYAVQRILDLKSRDPAKGLILIAGDVSQVDYLLGGLSVRQKQRLISSWPGHTTWLIPHCNKVPNYISGEHVTVAIRVSAHPVVKALCSLVGGPIVSTSANPQGLQPARTAFRVKQYFSNNVIYAPGQVGRYAQPSKIYDLESSQLIRA